MSQRSLFTSESVSAGHPDKLCDQISDAVLDAYLDQDKSSRVACEALAKTGFILVAGEITSDAHVDIPRVVRRTVEDIGYIKDEYGFNYKTCGVQVAVEQQSPDIARGVDASEDGEQGAGDQGLMFGYATDETSVLMPMPIVLAHRLLEELARMRTEHDLDYLRPDAKSQVTIEYEGDRPVRVHTIVVSTQHSPEVSRDQIRKDVVEKLVPRVIPTKLLDDETIYHVNPTGRFVIGGPVGDAGLTGRKIIVDTYGGAGRHGGGAFSGKDPSKVDRSASYAARYIAKNIVAAGLARRCEVQLAYAIGVAEPVSIRVDTYGTGVVSEERLADLVRDLFPVTPAAIIRELDLLRPIYRETAAYGHFGREVPSFTWERTDKVEVLRKKAGTKEKVEPSTEVLC